MTTTKDNFEVWSEAAYAYIKTQLRTNAVLISSHIRQIEVGIPDLDDIATHHDAMPVVWISPNRVPLGRSGGYMTHRAELTVHVLSLTERGAGYAAGQLAHRVLAGKVKNEVFELRDGGKQLGHWLTLDPNGAIEYDGVAGANFAILHATIPVAFTRDRPWIQGA